MKYVVFRDRSCDILGTADWPRGGQTAAPPHHRIPVLFPRELTHSLVAESLRRRYPGLMPESAAFVGVRDGQLVIEGTSESLGIGPRVDGSRFLESDAEVIARLLGLEKC